MNNPLLIVLIILVLPFALLMMPVFVVAATFAAVYYVAHEWYLRLRHIEHH